MTHSSGFKRGVWIGAALLAFVAVPGLALAQQGGGNTGGGNTGGGSTGGGNTGGGNTGGGNTGGGNTGGGRTTGGGSGGSSAIDNLGSGAVGGQRSTGQNAPSASNVFGAFYSYPVVTALPAISTGSGQNGTATASQRAQSTVRHTVPSFGSTTYTTTNSRAGNTGRTNRNTATINGRNQQDNGFNLAPSGGTMTRMPNYAATARISSTPISSERILTDVRAIVARSSSIPSKEGITVEANGRDVTLRGVVANSDERRFVEGLIRTTPGVGRIVNELTVKE